MYSKIGFEEMEPIFGELNAEWSDQRETAPLWPFLFLVYPLPNDPCTLRVLATDFRSNTWEALKSQSQLEDMRDNIGIGGSWSDFVEYITTSIKSEDVKLVMDGNSQSGGAANAKLIAQKAKGMPRISISLNKLVDAAANEAIANFSLELYKSYKNMHSSLINEEKCCCQLTKVTTAEQEKSGDLQRPLDTMLYSKKQKLQKENDKLALDGHLVGTSQDSLDKQITQHTTSTRGASRVVPVHRRAKVRGVLLQDTEDDAKD